MQENLHIEYFLLATCNKICLLTADQILTMGQREGTLFRVRLRLLHQGITWEKTILLQADVKMACTWF